MTKLRLPEHNNYLGIEVKSAATKQRYLIPLFSRAYAEFSRIRLTEHIHATLITEYLGDQLIGHIRHDSTEIDARERPKNKW